MSKKEKRKISKKGNVDVEDTTKYGEFVASYFSWLTPERQKKRAEELNNMTKK